MYQKLVKFELVNGLENLENIWASVSYELG